MIASNAVHIVMIEDDDGHALLIEKNIRRAGILNPLERFADGESGLARLFDGSTGPRLMLLDLNLPDMSGIEILTRVKAPDSPLRRAPVIVLTTTDDTEEIRRCYDLGCNVYVTKPLDYGSFSRAIRELGLFLTVIQVPDAA
ncbi:response regulator [Sphingomonas sp. Leaf21]|uniref:response regulator n=1 Tax=Sphingomonas sp. Leaf21 TaxID=2876550 RepID=UPI001E4BF876|nr:response regulator [Sphingomonas sp. Leaf21]